MIKLFLSLLVLSLTVCTVAQVSTFHPSTYYGLGQCVMTSDPVQHALGNTSLAFTDSTYINYGDPSSYHKIADGYPLFSFQLHDQYSIYNDGQSTANVNRLGIHQFALAIPFAKRFGLAFGLKPTHRRDYEFGDFELIDGDTLFYNYRGSGALNRAYVGASMQILKIGNLDWSVGAHGGYVFGTLENRRSASLENTSSGGVALQSIRVRGLDADFASSLTYRINGNNEINISQTYRPSMTVDATYRELIYFTFDVNSSNLANAQAASFTDVDGIVSFAERISTGVRYGYSFTRTTRKNKTRNSKLDFVFSSEMVKDQNLRLSDNFDGNQNPYTSDFSQWSLGVQFRPETKLMQAAGKTSFFTNCSYRFGYYQATLPVSGEITGSSQFGTTFGLGIPLTRQRAISSLNIGFEIGERLDTYGNAQGGGQRTLKQQNYGLTFGLTVSPSAADRWFRKRKLD